MENKPMVKKARVDWSNDKHRKLYTNELTKLLEAINFEEILRSAQEEMEFNTQTVILLLKERMKKALHLVENELARERKIYPKPKASGLAH
jgi:hypothetical protein